MKSFCSPCLSKVKLISDKVTLQFIHFSSISSHSDFVRYAHAFLSIELLVVVVGVVDAGVVLALLYVLVIETVDRWTLMLCAMFVHVAEALVLHNCAPLLGAGCLCFSISCLRSTVGLV